MGDGAFAADSGNLEAGGIRIKRMAGIIRELHTNLAAVHPEDGIEGDSDIENALRANYLPAAAATREFFENLHDLVDTHGDNVLNLTGLVVDVDGAASTEAGGHGRRG